MIVVKMVFTGDNAPMVARSLQPDNLPGIKMEAEGDRLNVEFSAEKIGTVLSTTDDILMNIKIAKEALASSEAL